MLKLRAILLKPEHFDALLGLIDAAIAGDAKLMLETLEAQGIPASSEQSVSIFMGCLHRYSPLISQVEFFNVLSKMRDNQEYASMALNEATFALATDVLKFKMNLPDATPKEKEIMKWLSQCQEELVAAFNASEIMDMDSLKSFIKKQPNKAFPNQDNYLKTLLN